MKSYRVKVRSPREWGIDFSSKKKELKTEKCARVGFERAAEGGGGVLAEQKRELSDLFI